MKSQLIPYLLLLLLLFSCQEDRQSVGTSSNNLNDQEWSIPQDWVFDGGPGFEGIPAINQPKYSSLEFRLTNKYMFIHIK